MTSIGDDKTFLCIHPLIRDQPGVLANTLKIFSDLYINLEYIQSRPDGNSGYLFYIELNGHQKDNVIDFAIDIVKHSLDPNKKHPATVKILGSYKNTHWKDEILTKNIEIV